MVAKIPVPKKRVRTLGEKAGSIYFARFSTSGTYSLTGGANRQICLFNPHTGLLIRSYRGHSYEVLSASWAPDGSFFVSVGGDRSGFVFDVSTGVIQRRLDGHSARINDIVLLGEHGDELCVTGSYDGDVRVWDLRQRGRCCVQVMGEAEDSVTGVTWSRQWGIVASSVDGYVRQYDMRRGAMRKDWIGASVGCVRVSSDNECVLVRSLDSKLWLLSLGGGDLLAEYGGGKNEGFRLECGFTSGDGMVVAGSEDGKLLYWDLVEGGKVPLASVDAHEGPVSAVATHWASETVLTGSHDGKVHLWKV